MRSAFSLTALATLALALLGPSSVSATFNQGRKSCKDKNGTCRTASNRAGFNFKVGQSTICVPDNWRCGSNGVTCGSKPTDDFCPENYGWCASRSPFASHSLLRVNPDL